MWVVYTKCVPKNSVASEDVIFYLLWYNVISWSFFFSHSIVSYWSLVNSQGKCLYGPITNFFVFCFFFFVILFYSERKWLLLRNLATILPLKRKLSGKFQRFNAINRSIKMLKVIEFSKISVKMKNFKTFYKAQTADYLKKFIQSPPITTPNPSSHQIKYYVSETNFFFRRYIKIYRHLLSRCFKNAVLGCQEMMQCIYSFWRHTETCLL